ncbi:MAG: glycosyltransferase family 39 protein [Chloroflexi bacterium]|nr:glycosyltransferase family 39 protein [Chloroflexota bacterium]
MALWSYGAARSPVLACTVMRPVLALYGLALLVRLAFLALFPDPAYPDSYYYVDVAQALHAGRGFNIDFIWVFVDIGGWLPADPQLPIPSNAHWMPLASIVQVPFFAVLGFNGFAAGLPFALIGAFAAPLTFAIARDAGAPRLVQIGAGLLTAAPAASAVFMTQPDNFSLYQPLVAGALWLGARGLRGDARSYAFAGLLVGLATLSRNDGILVGLAVGLLFAWDRWRWIRASVRPRPRPTIPFWAAVVCAGLFLLVMAPWWLRQLDVFGSLSPSSASGRILFIRSMADMNSVTADVSFSAFLDQGLAALVESRVLGFVAAVGIFSVLVGSVFLAPLMVVGAWLRRRSVAFRPFLLYAVILFAFSALVSAIHVPGGTFIHSAVALAPHAYILALEAVVAIVVWVARRRPAWDVRAASRVFVGGAVALTIATSVIYGLAVVNNWSQVRIHRQAVATALAEAGAAPTDRVMSIDAGGYRYWTGRGGVVTPDDPIETIEAVARAYDIRWLVLERREIVRAMVPVLGGTRPGWIGTPIFTLQAPANPNDEINAIAAPETTAGYPAVALFPVCLTTADTRCATTALGGSGS